MELPRTRALLPALLWRESTPSTNAELRDLIVRGGQELPHGAMLATTNQTAGRGRAGRGWVTPPDTSIAASVLLRSAGVEHVVRGLGPGWLPLIAGSAIAEALQPSFDAGAVERTNGAGLVGARTVKVKWPNDVHVRDAADTATGRPGRKLCGILCELLGDGSVIVGTGINLLIEERDLPTERASSLLAAGADTLGARTLAEPAGAELTDRVLAAYAEALRELISLARTNPAAVRDRVRADSATLGCRVRVHLPGGEVVDGFARELAHDGSLVVERYDHGGGEPEQGARDLVVSAGDVEHLR
ncbi:biotin--[acetyl-CoA-carboxylase] ligase [Leucobacter sp. GX24907]